MTDTSIISPLIATLNNIAPISNKLEDKLANAFIMQRANKGDLLLQEGNFCNRLWFLSDGVLRSYHTIGDKEVTSRIMFTGHIVISPGSFFMQIPATESIEALSDCTLASLSFEELQKIYKSYPDFNYHGRIITEQYFSKQEQRLYMLRKHDAIDKYRFFIENYSDYIKHIPQKYLATFLNIAPETLSRIRRKFSE